MASITLKNLTKSFAGTYAVNDVNLEIQDGEFIALLGPSGCGKTTALRMICGLETPTSGSIHIGEREVTYLYPRERDVAMVFQDYALYPHMTIEENIGYPLKVRGVATEQRHTRVMEAATHLQIAKLLERRPAQLSGGQQQRTALARALVHSAQVFLFDEPLSNLDAQLRLEARAFLKRLQLEFGMTGVYVTHDQSEAMALADRIVVMSQGRIMQAGTPLEIYRQPVNTFVASFIGTPAMNLLECRYDASANTLIVTPEDILDAAQFTLPASLKTGDITLGIRPEHLTIATEATPNSIRAEVYVTQTLGSESLVVVRVGGQILSVRLFGDTVPTLPPHIWLVPDFSRAFFYNTEGTLIQ